MTVPLKPVSRYTGKFHRAEPVERSMRFGSCQCRACTFELTHISLTGLSIGRGLTSKLDPVRASQWDLLDTTQYVVHGSWNRVDRKHFLKVRSLLGVLGSCSSQEPHTVSLVLLLYHIL